ncbi:DUF5666 domain-containing protein [Hydrogenophaga sp. ZJX-1]|uniref:DUF5666 domain-containing protein n=1 Tax=Hydrogenophaga sp. ZJX-1 TaxID=3404778 RepID=UPI003B283733
MKEHLRAPAAWAALLTLCLAAGCSHRLTDPPLSGAAACRVASLTNPAAMAPGLGGTGAPAVVADPGGIGGTGRVAQRPGVGGTGQVAGSPGLGGTGAVAGAAGLSHEGGLGGTGIVGVVTGFASICVNGVEVGYQPETPVQRDGAQAPLSDLAVGQWVALQASGQGAQLQARRIVVLDTAVGPLSSVDAASGRFVVMGQPAVALEAADLAGLQAGDWARVSGQRLASGEIRATRVQAWTAGEAQVTGPLRRAPDGTLRVGETPVVSRDPALLVGTDGGGEVAVRGEWADGRLIASELQRQPTRSAVGEVREVLLQGYVHALNGRELQLGYGALTLSDATRVRGGELEALSVGQAVRVRGRVDAQQRVMVELLEFQRESRRGNSRRASVRSNDDADADDPDDSGSSGKSSSGSDDSSGRGRGRGGDGDSSGSGSSGSGSSGSGSSGSGSSGGDSSGSGSSGSGTSGSSGSSGSGSSGSGSSGSGSSGGGSGKGRGRGRGSKD